MIHNRKVSAIVPIKANIEGNEDKNLRDFCGKSLYTYVLETLDKTYAVDEVIVDTNNELIISKAPQLFDKVLISKRPYKLSPPSTNINKIIEHDIERFDADIYLQTHVTNPLLKPETIANSLKIFIELEDGYDSLFSVNKYNKRFYDSNGKALNHDLDNLVRTYELSPVYEENSILYIFTKESFFKKKNRIGLKPKMLEISHVEAIDINDEITFRFAEVIALYKK